MAFDENKDLGRRYFAAFSSALRGEPEGFDEIDRLVTDDWHEENGYEGLPTGPEGLKHLARKYAKFISDPEIVINEIFAEEDVVVVRTTDTGLHTGLFLNQPATGVKLEAPSYAILRLRDGRVASSWRTTDRFSELMQMGVVPPMSEEDGEPEGWAYEQ